MSEDAFDTGEGAGYDPHAITDFRLGVRMDQVQSEAFAQGVHVVIRHGDGAAGATDDAEYARDTQYGSALLGANAREKIVGEEWKLQSDSLAILPGPLGAIGGEKGFYRAALEMFSDLFLMTRMGEDREPSGFIRRGMAGEIGGLWS